MSENNDNLENVEQAIEDEFTEDETDATVEEDETSENGEPETQEEPVVEDNTEPELESEVVTKPEIDENEKPQVFSIDGNNITLNFQLSHSDQRIGLYKILDSHVDNGYHYILDMYNDHAIVEQVVYDDNWEEREEKILRVNFATENDEITIGEVEEVFPMYLTSSEKDSINAQREEIESLNSRLEELSEYKENSEFAAKEQLVSEYESELEEEVVKSIRENFSTMTVEDVEKEVALEFFKKTQAEKKETETSVAVQKFSATKEKKFGSLDKYFK